MTVRVGIFLQHSRLQSVVVGTFVTPLPSVFLPLDNKNSLPNPLSASSERTKLSIRGTSLLEKGEDKTFKNQSRANLATELRGFLGLTSYYM